VRRGLQMLIALLFLSAWSSTPAAEGDNLERATEACATGALAFTMVAEKPAYDINAVDSDQGREAFLAEVESFDKHQHEMPAFKAIWLLSLERRTLLASAQRDGRQGRKCLIWLWGVWELNPRPAD
jgi:hypothetical protein